MEGETQLDNKSQEDSSHPLQLLFRAPCWQQEEPGKDLFCLPYSRAVSFSFFLQLTYFTFSAAAALCVCDSLQSTHAWEYTLQCQIH